MSATSEAVRAFYASHGDVTPELTETCLREEIDELLKVLDKPTFRPFGIKDTERQRKLARELADVIWCCHGHAQAAGIDLDIALQIICRSNLAKLPSCPNPSCEDGEVPGGSKGHLICPDCEGSGNGKPTLRDDGKVMRPELWTAPNLSAAVIA